MPPNHAAPPDSGTDSTEGREDTARLLHELQTYQAELEMQNEELRRTQAALEDSRARFVSLYDFAPLGYLTLSLEGGIEDANLTAAAMFGEHRDRLIHRFFAAYVDRDDADNWDRWFRGPAGQRSSQNLELTMRRADGKTFHARLDSLRIESDPAVLRLAIADDTANFNAATESRLLQERLTQVQKVEALGLLAGGVAHDFNNILGSILGFATLAQEQAARNGDTELAGYVSEIRVAGERGRGLVEKLLATSRRSPGTDEMRPLAPGGVVLEVIRMLSSTFPASIEIRSDIQACLPGILVSSGDLHQLLMNLCINARDASGATGKIGIGLRLRPDMATTCASCGGAVSGDHVELSVADNGPGVRPEILSRLFDPFFTTKEVGKGTGLGLAVVHGIVHRVGGHILVETRPGEGMTVRLLFRPVEYAAAGDVPTAAPRPEQPVTPGTHVMVVDDEPALTRLWCSALKKRGYRVTAFNDSGAALAAFREATCDVDIVVSDLTMPGLTGEVLAREMLALRPDLPFILCSGYCDDTDADHAVALGVRAFLNKPVSIDTLLREIEAVIPAGEGGNHHHV
jgi:signal transduction histidine kinase/ActR/RegA family two-component response regulator